MENRIIKFRAWNLEDYCKGEEYTNDYIPANSMVDWAIMQDDKNKWFEEEEFGKKFILMQYTGLTDKNRVEIYEGDIIKYSIENDVQDKPMIIKNLWNIRRQMENPDSYFRIDYAGLEVIGNIYENKDLRK